MTRSLRRLALGTLAATVLATLPLTALASRAHVTHTLPKSTGTTPVAVFSFGLQGGNIRPWSIKLNLDGSIASSGTATSRQRLTDPKNSLQGLLTLADAEGFFAMKKSIGCLGSAGNPDAGAHFISVRTAQGAKRVNEFGSCKATAKFDQLYAVLAEVSGIGS
ncbi:MAG TPA: hypothetical protein VKX16_14075 [Chloroflexota bacterium]|nr:hypothetical protein [Chloroflexota bacterium]